MINKITLNKKFLSALGITFFLSLCICTHLAAAQNQEDRSWLATFANESPIITSDHYDCRQSQGMQSDLKKVTEAALQALSDSNIFKYLMRKKTGKMPPRDLLRVQVLTKLQLRNNAIRVEQTKKKLDKVIAKSDAQKRFSETQSRIKLHPPRSPERSPFTLTI